jgi:hypothetical protein
MERQSDMHAAHHAPALIGAPAAATFRGACLTTSTVFKGANQPRGGHYVLYNGGGLSSYNSSSSCEWREGSADDHQEVDLTGPGFGLGLDLSPSPPVHLKSHNPPPSPAISLTTPQGRHGMLWPMGILLSTCNCNGEELNDSSHSQEDSYAPVTRSTYYQSTTLPTILLLRIARQHNWNLGDYAKTEIWLVNEIYSAGEVPS